MRLVVISYVNYFINTNRTNCDILIVIGNDPYHELYSFRTNIYISDPLLVFLSAPQGKLIFCSKPLEVNQGTDGKEGRWTDVGEEPSDELGACIVSISSCHWD